MAGDLPLGTVAREAIGPKPYPDQCAVDRLGAHDPRLREQAHCLHTERARGRARSTHSPLKFHEGPGADRGSSNRCRLACGTAESRRIDFWQSRVKILAEKLGCSRRRRIRTVARITHNCIHRRIATMLGRKCEFPATFGPGQYLPAARATMYGRCLRSAAVLARAVRGMGRRRVGRSTARHTPDAALRIHVRVGKLVLKTQTEEHASALNTSGLRKSPRYL